MIFLRNESVGYFFSEITHILPSPPPQKSNGRSLRLFRALRGRGGGGELRDEQKERLLG